MVMVLGQLPGELYSSIFSHIPLEDCQWAVLSLSRVFPDAPIPLYYLYENIRIGKPEQAVLLYSHLRKLRTNAAEDASSSPLKWIHCLSIETWTVDADVVLNIVRIIVQHVDLRHLNVWVGPNNFAPEHLEEMFQNPIQGLAYLDLRFRPYVKKATYYQFLKGAYFDSTLSALSRWPVSNMPVLSIVQDPFDAAPSLVPAFSRQFAQPLVFFRLDPHLSALLRSQAQALNAFRLRVPSRPVVRSLCSPPLISEDSDGRPIHMPQLEILDLSTSGVLEGEVDLLLVHYKDLKHLLLDECAILRGELRQGEWSAMGKRCAMAGARRAKECEKALSAWYDRRNIAAAANGSDGAPASVGELTRRPRRGRRGLATPTISIRSRSPPAGAPHSSQPSSSTRQPLMKFKILPPVPSLRTLCTTASPTVNPSAYSTIQAEFKAGWDEGVAQLAVRRARMRDSARLGTVILRFTEGSSSLQPPEGGCKGLVEYAATHGLEMVGSTDLEAFDMLGYGSGSPQDIPSPILCLAGESTDIKHIEDCGHSVVSDIWPEMTT